MQHTEVDHLVVAAATLAEGEAWCERVLGQASVPGGRHALMSTHNRLLALGSPVFPRCYLEIIALDPLAPPPGRARWFDLDNPRLQDRLHRDGPQLVGFVARSAMVDIHRWGLINCRLQPGPTLKASRDTPNGLLQWQIVVPDDGRPLAGGAVPTLIQWQGLHPADHLPASAVHLQALTIRGLPEQAAQVLRLRGVARQAEAGPPLQAMLDTPLGPVTLSGPPEP